MSLVTPTRSFVGGLLLLLPVFLSPRLLSSPYGISGALHRSASRERTWAAVASTAGLLAGGAVVGALLPTSTASAAKDIFARSTAQWARWLVSGLFVGAGSKLANGCTSGHMLSGLTRQSPRSLVATAMFFLFGGLTAGLLPAGEALPAGPIPWDWTLGGVRGLFLVGAALLAAGGATLPSRVFGGTSSTAAADKRQQELSTPAMQATQASLLSLSFAFSLALSGMLSTTTILSFLSPFSTETAWNPSLMFLAGVLPISVALYAGPKPARDSEWAETRLWVGAALFGTGWGMSGVCPGPGIVNLGQALVSGVAIPWWAAWVGASLVGGKVAEASCALF